MWADGTAAFFMRLHAFSDRICAVFKGRYIKDLADGTYCSSIGTATAFLCELPGSHSQSQKVPMGSHREEMKREGKETTFHLPYPANSTWPHFVVTCPDGHVTVSMLVCDPGSVCWQSRDGFAESEVWGVPTKTSCGVALTSLPAMMACDNSAELVPYGLVCDHLDHCGDGSDESFCVFQPCSKDLSFKCGLSSQVSTKIPPFSTEKNPTSKQQHQQQKPTAAGEKA